MRNLEYQSAAPCEQFPISLPVWQPGSTTLQKRNSGPSVTIATPTTFIALITLMWQISMHAMSITSATIAAGVFFSVGVAVALVPLVVLVGAARLQLKRHTPAQILAGTLVGAIVPVVVLLVIAAYM